jgi:hypothetical protein
MARVKDRNSFKCTLLYRLGEPLLNVVVQKKGTVECAVCCVGTSGDPGTSGTPGTSGNPNGTGTIGVTGGPTNVCNDESSAIVETVINQLDIVVDDALDYFKAMADLGSESDLMVLQLIEGQMEYILCDDVTSVNQPLPAGRASSNGLGFQFDAEETEAAVGLFSWQSQFGARGIYGHLGGGTYDNLLTTEIAMEYISLIEMRFQVKFSTEYNQASNRLVVWPEPKASDDGKLIVLQVNRKIGDDKCFANTWLQEYATALLAKQVGANLSKYEGFQFPTGGSWNPQYYIQRAQEDIEKLQEEMKMGSGRVGFGSHGGGVFLTG